MAVMETADHKKFHNCELIWFVRKNRPGALGTGKRKKPFVVRKAKGLGLTEAEFVAFWARDDIRNHPQNLWNKAKFKSSKAMKKVYADIDGEEEEEGDAGEDEEDDEGDDEGDDGEDANDGEDGEEEEEPIHEAEVVQERDEEPEEKLDPFPEAQASTIATSTHAANSSDNNGATSSEHVSSYDTPAQTNPAPTRPPDTKEYTELKELLRKVTAEATAEAMVDSEDSD